MPTKEEIREAAAFRERNGTGLEPAPAEPTPAEMHQALRAFAEVQEQVKLDREQNQKDRAELAEVKAALERDRQLVHRMMGDDEGLASMVVAAREQERETARRRIYQRLKGKQVTIRFHTERDPNRNFPVHVNLNGNYHNIPRGVPYTLPGEFIEVIDRARVFTAVREVDSKDNPRLRIHDYLNFPYEILKGLDDEDRLAAAS